MRLPYVVTVAALLLIVIFCIAVVLVADSNPGGSNLVCIRDVCFGAELPSDPSEMARGLMFREHLDGDKGMLFVFEREGIHPFWMKNTLIPLDIIWIGSEMEIVYISRNTEPCSADPCRSISPGGKAKYVLEINGGLSERYGFEVGDGVSIKTPGFSA